MKTEIGLLTRYLASNFSELQRTIQIADAKANIVIVLIGVIISLFFNFFISKNVIGGFEAMIILSVLFISGGFAISTLYPRIAKKSGKFSMIYFKDVADIDVKKTMKEFEQKDYQDKIVEDYLNNIKILSSIVDKKFIKLRLAYIFLGLGIITKVFFEFSAWL